MNLKEAVGAGILVCLSIVTILAIIVLLIAACPLIMIWAINGLFDLEIAITLGNWFKMFLLLFIPAGYGRVKAS